MITFRHLLPETPLPTNLGILLNVTLDFIFPVGSRQRRGCYKCTVHTQEQYMAMLGKKDW